MNMTKKRWAVLAACCIVNLCLGSLYAWSVFSSALAAHFTALGGTEITSGDLAIVYTIANAVGPITMITGGRINDKMGPKMVILLAGVLFGVGMFLSSFATNVGFLIVTYGLLVGLGIGLGYGCAVSVSVKFFPDKRGLIGGITTASYGLSSVIVPPIVTGLVGAFDVTVAFKVLGIVFLVLIVICSFIVKKCPDGFVPDGWTPPAPAVGKSGPEDKNWKQMLSTPIFYIMIILLMAGAFSGMMFISQASAVAQEMMGFTAAAAGITVSVLALFNAFGRIAAGFLSDRIGRINTLTISCVLSIIGLFCLYLSGNGSVVLFYIGVAIVGICFGSFMGVYPGFTADRFGAKNNSVNYGIMFIGFAFAGFVGPMAMKSVYGATGAYAGAFLICIALSVVGILLTFVYRAMVKKAR